MHHCLRGQLGGTTWPIFTDMGKQKGVVWGLYGLLKDILYCTSTRESAKHSLANKTSTGVYSCPEDWENNTFNL